MVFFLRSGSVSLVCDRAERSGRAGEKERRREGEREREGEAERERNDALPLCLWFTGVV